MLIYWRSSLVNHYAIQRLTEVWRFGWRKRDAFHGSGC